MAAGLGFKTFNTGDVLSAADTNGYLMQGIWVFANATARDAAVTLPQEGNSCYLKDTDVIQVYSGSAWVTKSGSSPLTTKGDLYTYSTTDTRLGVGTNGQVLTADSAEASGIKWATISAGGMTLISETSASALSSLSFSSLGNYKQLLLMYSGIRHSNNGTIFGVRFNNSSSSIYHTSGLQVTGSTLAISASSPDNLSGQAGGYYIYAFGQKVNNAAISTDVMGSILIDNYTSTTKSKSILASFNYYNNSDAVYQVMNTNFLFDSTSAITSIDIVRLSGAGTFSNTGNTTIRLYGVS